jgi:pimeloyl-ACP methyl ester carboxylesterase
VIDRSYRNRSRPGLIPPILSLTRNLPLWEASFAMRLHEIRHPTLVMWGTEDRVFPPQVGRELHQAIPGSSFVLIAKAGHMPQWEQPESVNPVLLRFLQP